FRDIFKNAYLPYRDPETLKLFLKTINEFTYDHSERLGDAFEYLLSVLGSQGDAGQFRTPRHIIDFMVEIIKPQKNESILDPACGTAGFLIASYKHIIRENTSPRFRSDSASRNGSKSSYGKGDLLTAEERKKLLKNFKGYDISPDMVRLSLVNLYLHGFVQPQIFEYDTLTSEDRWNEYADVIMANPPFMSPKGGIKPHKKFSMQSNRSEVLFVDYIAEHLTPTGRAAVIVPEGIIFQSAGAYKQLRKYLVDTGYLYGVVSLPAGIFNPYSGVKTSILLMDRSIAKKTDSILFIKIENDGFNLGAQRREIVGSDLPDALNVINDYIKAVRTGTIDSFKPEEKPCGTLLIKKAQLAENDDYNLSGERYRTIKQRGKQKWPIVRIEEIANTTSGGTPPRNRPEYFINGSIPWLKSGEVGQGRISKAEEYITKEGLENSSSKIIPANTVLVALYGATAGQVGILQFDAAINQAICAIITNDRMLPNFLFQMLKTKTSDLIRLSTGGGQQNLSQSIIKETELPLPPLEVQREIVAEIEGYQKLIDGARQVVDSWKPQIEIDPKWPMVKLEDVCSFTQGVQIPQEEQIDHYKDGYKRYIYISDLMHDEKMIFVKDQYPNKEVSNRDLIMVNTGNTSGKVFFGKSGVLSNNVFNITHDESVNINYLYYHLSSDRFYNHLSKYFKQGAQPHLGHRIIGEQIIPLPPLKVQQDIATKIEAERKVIDGCRELIKNYELKIKNVIDKVWEE
ncbi:MAG: N-6 DNA methylase, partial [Bacteroidota bacterium]